MHSLAFLQDLAVVLLIAGLVTILFNRLKQPVVLGYILAGFLIGPHTPPASLIHSEETIHTLAELGIILLMFSLGLEFNLRKLREVGMPALGAALLEILGMGWVGFELGRAFGWSTTDSLFLGAMLSMSSTTIIIKVFQELGRTREKFAQLVFGILIVEDILGIAMIALLSGIAMTGSLSVGAVGMTLGKLGVFLATALVAGLIVVPRLIRYVARFKSDEMLLVTVLALCFGMSLLATKLGYSVALGAFVIGAIIAEAREIHRIETLVAPVRDMFSAVFFVAIGLMIDPSVLVEYWVPILAITGAVLVCKIVACSSGIFLGGYDSRTAMRVGMSVAQIGEFSFIIAALGVSLKVTSAFLYPVAVAVSTITTLLTPYLIRAADTTADGVERHMPARLLRIQHLYTKWVGQLGNSNGTGNHSTRILGRLIGTIGLNALLLAADYIVVAVLAHRPPAFLLSLGLSDEWRNNLLWLAATIAAIPLILASFRKLQALGLVLAETRIPEAKAGPHTTAIRTVVANAVSLVGLVLLGLYVLALSSTFLPSMRTFLLLAALLLVLAWALRRSFSQMYSRAQAALTDTFTSPDFTPPPTPRPLPGVLRQADLATLVVTESSPVVGQLIRECEIRSRTGASIVGIERNGADILNPGPDEELRAGDQILILGLPAQLQAAEALIGGVSKPDNDAA